MRCVACGAEMLLVKVVPDHTMMVPGYERYTLQCLGCYEVKEHLVFNRERPSRGAEAAPSLSVLTLACDEADRDLDVKLLLDKAPYKETARERAPIVPRAR